MGIPILKMPGAHLCTVAVIIIIYAMAVVWYNSKCNVHVYHNRAAHCVHLCVLYATVLASASMHTMYIGVPYNSCV